MDQLQAMDHRERNDVDRLRGRSGAHRFAQHALAALKRLQCSATEGERRAQF
jgi:hypothetical protein